MKRMNECLVYTDRAIYNTNFYHTSLLHTTVLYSRRRGRRRRCENGGRRAASERGRMSTTAEIFPPMRSLREGYMGNFQEIILYRVNERWGVNPDLWFSCCRHTHAPYPAQHSLLCPTPRVPALPALQSRPYIR